jgi:hypothetical protein
MQVKVVVSKTTRRTKREEFLKAARGREIDGTIVWRLDLWCRSYGDLVVTQYGVHSLRPSVNDKKGAYRDSSDTMN